MPRATKAVSVVALDAQEGLQEAQRATALKLHPVRRAEPIPSLGAQDLVIGLDEYVYRLLNNGSRYTLLVGFKKAVASLGGADLQLPRSHWDELRGKYEGAVRGIGITAEDLKALPREPVPNENDSPPEEEA